MADKWILTRLHDTIATVSERFDGFDFGNAADAIWRFVWYEFCDWYLEATKVAQNHATRAAVLSFVWNNAMRVLHPIAPFISEEVWLALPHDGVTIMTATWPDRLEVPVDRDAAAAFEVHMARNRADSPPQTGARVAAALEATDALPGDLGAAALDAIASLRAGRRGGDDCGGRRDPRVASAESWSRRRRTLLLERYRKDATRLRSEVERGESKLGNAGFIAKAAPERGYEGA